MSQFTRSFFFVGINTYTNSTRELRGCVYDVLDALGSLLDIQADLSTAVVCTAPKLTAEEVARHYAAASTDPDYDALYKDALDRLSGTGFFGASKAEILGAAAKAFQADRGNGHVGLNWSGHGQLIDGVYHLAPSDAAGHDYDGAAATMIQYPDLLQALGLCDDDSVLALLDTCDAGSVSDSDYSDRPNDLILTSGGPAQEIRERYIGGQWRGLMSWAFHRVLEQYNATGSGDSSGINVSYGNIVRDIRALTAIFQGVECTPAVPQLHGTMANAAGTLQRRVGQSLTAPPGATLYRAAVVGGGVQMWGDVDHIVVYDVEAEGHLVARVFINASNTEKDVNLLNGYTEVLKANQETWIFLESGLSAMPPHPGSYKFTLKGTWPNTPNPVTIPLDMSGYSTQVPGRCALVPNWVSQQNFPAANYKDHAGAGTFAFKLTYDTNSLITKVRWLRSDTTPTPFKVGNSNATSVEFNTGMSGTLNQINTFGVNFEG